ncbi:MAG: APC family permease [Chloroflexota bacterium]|nr:APC family permease [Chloroflexota bacterium]
MDRRAEASAEPHPGVFSRLGTFLIGSRLPTSQASEERLSNPKALAILSSDVLSSTAYATEEMLAVLVLGGLMALTWSIPISVAIVGLMVILITSYQQLIRAYPAGGGTYQVVRENLGTSASLVAASGLFIDYILTVAVSVSAGVAALVSAFHGLAPLRVEMAVLMVLFLMVVNLRGVRETGRFLALPTMLFVGSMLVLLAVGFARYFLDLVPEPTTVVSTPALGGVALFLLLRAFSAGSTALTGIEAVSDSTRVFKPPEARNANRTLLWVGVILAILFLSVTFLARRFGVAPVAEQTVLSQLARAVLGQGPLYYFIQFSTLLVLLVAANASFSGFPRLASILGQDRYLPRQLSDVGSRLVYTNGIVLLALVSALIIVVFHANVHSLIPIYAVGVFISFTLSQAGLVKHWLKSRGSGWLHGTAINGFGAVVTGVALMVIAATKFTHGAWLIVLLVPLFLYAFYRIHKHYEMVAEELSLDDFTPPAVPTKQTVIVPVSALHRAVLEALAYARSISSDVRAVYVASDLTVAEELRNKWQRYVPDIPLEIIHSPYRMVINELVKYLDRLQAQENVMVTVVIPEFVPMHWWELLLHSQTAWMLKAVLLFRKRIPVTSVPHHLRR